MSALRHLTRYRDHAEAWGGASGPEAVVARVGAAVARLLEVHVRGAASLPDAMILDAVRELGLAAWWGASQLSGEPVSAAVVDFDGAMEADFDLRDLSEPVRLLEAIAGHVFRAMTTVIEGDAVAEEERLARMQGHLLRVTFMTDALLAAIVD